MAKAQRSKPSRGPGAPRRRQRGGKLQAGAWCVESQVLPAGCSEAGPGAPHLALPRTRPKCAPPSRGITGRTVSASCGLGDGENRGCLGQRTPLAAAAPHRRRPSPRDAFAGLRLSARKLRFPAAALNPPRRFLRPKRKRTALATLPRSPLQCCRRAQLGAPVLRGPLAVRSGRGASAGEVEGGTQNSHPGATSPAWLPRGPVPAASPVGLW